MITSVYCRKSTKRESIVQAGTRKGSGHALFFTKTVIFYKKRANFSIYIEIFSKNSYDIEKTERA